MVRIKNIAKNITAIVMIISLLINLNSYSVLDQEYKEELPLSSNTGNVLLSTFKSFEPGTKAPLKRIIDYKHPMNLVNFYGNEPVTTLWSSIPANQKPFTIILIVLGHTLLPGNSTKYLEDTADICEENEIPYAIQVMSGETHNEERLPIAYLESRFAQKHQYFYGLNGAELYNGVTWRGEIESNNSQYIINCINLVVKYGAFFIWTDTNMNYDSGMMMQWFETNEAFYSAFKNNAENIVLMNKESYGTPSTYSVMQGLWLAGLVGNWGVASDWWHWQVDGDKKSLFGEFDGYVDNEWDLILSYPENMYVQSMMLVMSCGGTCFKAEAPNFSTSAGGVPIAGFEYGISPLLNSIINDEITIPTKDEVLQASPAAVLGKENYPDFNYNLTESNLYPATGRNRIIPLLPSNLRLAERAVFEDNGIVLIDKQMERECFDNLFPQEAAGNTYAMRTDEQWFYINNVENARSEKTAVMTPKICSASSFSITAQEHTSAIITEKADGLSFYISNYRTDKSNMVKTVTPEYRAGKSWVDICSEFMTIDENGNPKGLDDSIHRTTTITVNGKLNGTEPEIVWLSNTNGTGANNRAFSYSKIWDNAAGALTLVIKHNGVVKFDIIVDETSRMPGTKFRDPINPSLKTNENSTVMLQNLIASLPVVEEQNYIYYSYLKYNAALEKARVIIAEKTYSKLQIVQAKTELQKAYDNLVDISKCVILLGTAKTLINTSTVKAELSSLFDDLLRETLSNNIYSKGRSGNLEYMKNYKKRKFNAKAKKWVLEKRYNALLSEVNGIIAGD